MLGRRRTELCSRGVTHLALSVTLAAVVVVALVGLAIGGVLRYPPPTNGTSADPFVITFHESGLQYSELGAPSWSVTLAGTTVNSSHASITFAVLNGSYNYTIGQVTGYTSAPESGTVDVAGAAQEVGVEYHWTERSVYAVIFTEKGLPAGLNWSVTLNGSTIIAPSGGVSSMNFPEPIGTYSFVVGSVAGYIPEPASGNVTVVGSNQSLAVDFSTT